MRHPRDSLRPTTEGFYDTALNEAVEFESRKIVTMPAPVAKPTKVYRRPSVKTVLAGLFGQEYAAHRDNVAASKVLPFLERIQLFVGIEIQH